MNQKFLVLKADESGAGATRYEYVDMIQCEKSESRQCAADVIGDVGDGTYYVAPLGDKIVAETKRVISGVKATRAKAPATGKPAAKKAKKRGLNPEVKVKAGGDDVAGV